MPDDAPEEDMDFVEPLQAEEPPVNVAVPPLLPAQGTLAMSVTKPMNPRGELVGEAIVPPYA